MNDTNENLTIALTRDAMFAGILNAMITFTFDDALRGEMRSGMNTILQRFIDAEDSPHALLFALVAARYMNLPDIDAQILAGLDDEWLTVADTIERHIQVGNAELAAHVPLLAVLARGAGVESLEEGFHELDAVAEVLQREADPSSFKGQNDKVPGG